MAFAAQNIQFGCETPAIVTMGEGVDGAGRGSDTPTTVSDDAMMDEDHVVSTEMPTPSVQSRQVSDFTPDSVASRASEANTEGTKSRSSRFRGVCWNKKNKRWQAAINNGGRYIYLGSFTSDEEAARSFDLAALQIRGRNTKLNFSVDDYPEDEWARGAPPHLIEKYMSGTARTKPAPFRQFTGTPMKKLQPSHFAAIQVPVKRGRYEEAGFGKKAFDRAEQRFLSNAFFPNVQAGQPKIKQEFPQVPMAVDTPYSTVGTVGASFEKQPLLYIPKGIAPNDLQASRTIKTPSITTPPVTTGRPKDTVDPLTDFVTHELPFRSIAPDRMDDSAERKASFMPTVVARQPIVQSCPVPHPTDSNPKSDRLPVPILQSSQDEHSLHVSSVISETVAGSDIKEAKVFVGSSRNQFGLIHRIANNSKWNALVWDGTTMHSMGVYASEEDSEVACSSAVRLVETIMTRNS